MRDRMSRQNAKHFGDKAGPCSRRRRKIKIAGSNFYPESEEDPSVITALSVTPEAGTVSGVTGAAATA